ncbi:PD-(D/E)XK motif protein [Catellatospora citrea]|uniref:Uncharacterized protein n=1 Tax=Catellatospora citrea TaxID=53366 RepID=A0A8J3KGN9_9ACTN|nr:PD-(D/E)XK motif protein [Catellatospora citrea]RKE11126.1 putative PD-(D/E)XK family protein DUF4420 [Catellatospora citrea]GIF96588.1 hypothetical protein Cci01nite_16820 [Catellatospora citrea]
MTLDDMSVLERAWAVLSRPRSRELESFPLDVTCGDEPCRVALDVAGVRHLLVPVGDETVPVDPKPATLALGVRKIQFGGRVVAYVDVSCTDTDLFAEFDEVVEDVLEAVAGSPQPAAAAVAAVGRWRRLLRSRLMRGLSRQAKIGLFAELTVLSALVAADPAFPVQSWRGPLGEPHDFEASRHCLEVKGLGADADGVVIHGLDQLDAHDGRGLDLVLMRVVDDPDGRSVGDLVEHLRAAVGSRADLRLRLGAAGWQEQPDRPDPDSFSVGEVLRIRVGSETPRLVPSSLTAGALPQGVAGLSYRLDLAELLALVDGASLAEIAKEAVE